MRTLYPVATMGKRERAKGASGEREVASIFRAAGFDCDRTPNSGGLRIKGDLHGEIPLHVETKRQEVWRLPLWIAQTEADAGLIDGDPSPWLLAFRASRSPWYGVAPLPLLVNALAHVWQTTGGLDVIAGQSYSPAMLDAAPPSREAVSPGGGRDA
jgi:hypothetical protein